MIKRVLSKLNLYWYFTFFIFLTLFISIGFAVAIGITLWRAGITFTSEPEAGFMVATLLLSVIIGLVVTAIGSKFMLKPVREMLSAMKKLAGGDFSVRIDDSRKLRSKELRDFSAEFNAAAEELDGIEILRSDFINTFSHEFKTPIVSLRGFAKLLKEGKLSEQERCEYLDIIISESDRLAALATNVLNLSKIEHQSIVTDKETFNLSEQIRRSILIMESKWSEKELEPELELEEELLFFGNSEMLSQVWVNILDNAVKFSHRGGKLRVSLSGGKDTITCSVQDFGQGMDEVSQAHIFDKFFQGDRSRTTDGNGLGMAIVQRIVQLHKGRLTIKSAPGKGTLVTVILPVAYD